MKTTLLFASVFAAVRATFAVGGNSADQLPLSQGWSTSAQSFNQPAAKQSFQVEAKSLSSLTSDSFVQLSHPYFPKHSARIKKAEGFCDGNVK